MEPDTDPAPAQGRFAGREHRFPVRVYFEDTDLSGVVYYAGYLRFMERARSEMLRDCGVDQRATFEGGDGVYVVASLNIRYVKPARLDDALIVASQLMAYGAATCRIHQRVIRGDELLADAEVVAAFLSSEGRPKRQPRAWLDIFERLRRED